MSTFGQLQPPPQSGCPQSAEIVNIWKESETTATYNTEVLSDVINILRYCTVF